MYLLYPLWGGADSSVGIVSYDRPVPDADLPADLIALARAAREADDRMMAAARGDDDDVLTAAREAYVAAADALRQHPALEEAQKDGRHAKVLQAAKDAAKKLAAAS